MILYEINVINIIIIRATFRPTGAFTCYHLTIPELKNNGKSVMDVVEL